MDVHRFQKRYHNIITSLWKTNLPREDKEGIEFFLKDMRTKGIGFSRLIKLGDVLKNLGTKLKKPFAKATEQDIKNLVHTYETQSSSRQRKQFPAQQYLLLIRCQPFFSHGTTKLFFSII